MVSLLNRNEVLSMRLNYILIIPVGYLYRVKQFDGFEYSPDNFCQPVVLDGMLGGVPGVSLGNLKNQESALLVLVDLIQIHEARMVLKISPILSTSWRTFRMRF